MTRANHPPANKLSSALQRIFQSTNYDLFLNQDASNKIMNFETRNTSIICCSIVPTINATDCASVCFSPQEVLRFIGGPRSLEKLSRNTSLIFLFPSRWNLLQCCTDLIPFTSVQRKGTKRFSSYFYSILSKTIHTNILIALGRLTFLFSTTDLLFFNTANPSSSDF